MIDTPPAMVPGWYGKLPGLGDFANRRLPAEFIQAWDAWLQDRLVSSRIALGEGWVDCYLTTPIWRFVVFPGVIGASGWAGVLMPSIDRVGRQFPLTVALPLPSLGAVANAVFDRADWFAGLEEAALGALDIRRDAEDLERSLASYDFGTPLVADPGPQSGSLAVLPSVEQFGVVARVEAFRDWGLHAGFKSLWWSRGRVDDHALMLTSAVLPTDEEFFSLLRSRASIAPAGV